MNQSRRDSAERILVILGPTAGGKSELAVALARRFDGQIISADSMQIYCRLDAGTAKPTAQQRAAVPHHLIDVVEPTQPFTVADWLEQAERLIGQIRQRGRLPIIVGGTNLYLKGLLEGMFEGPGSDRAYRRKLAHISPQQLHRRLQEVDVEAAQRIHPNDRKRIIRALEVHHLTGRPISDQQRQWLEQRSESGEAGATQETAFDRRRGGGGESAGETSAGPNRPGATELPRPSAGWTAHEDAARRLGEAVEDTADVGRGLRGPAESRADSNAPDHRGGPSTYRFNPILLGLRWPPAAINRRINARVKQMFWPEDGCEDLVSETRRLEEAGLLGPQARQAIGTKQVLEYLQGRWTLAEAFERVKIETRRYAKNQRTWLKRFRGVHWLEAAERPFDQIVAEAAQIVEGELIP